MPSTSLVFGERTIEGRELRYWVLGEEGETLLLLGGIHGDERSSSHLAFDLLRWASEHSEELVGKRLVVAPLVNPDGYARNTRTNARGVDLNRNFPANDWRPGGHLGADHPGTFPRSEVETRFVMFLMSMYPPDKAISVHGDSSSVNWDGPAMELARAMGQDCVLPSRMSIGYPTPGSFGSFAGGHEQIPTITLELTDNLRIKRPVAGYRRALSTALRYLVPSRRLGVR